jgi:hypothetical protein
VAGASRPVQGGAYSGARSEPGGQNTPRAGRVVTSYGTYTVAVGLFAQQVDQGDIFDDAADATAIVAVDGSGAEVYASGDAATGAVTAGGTGAESWSGPAVYTDTGSGTVTAGGAGTEKRVYADDATYYDNVIDADNPVSHWKLGDPNTAVDRKGQRNLPGAITPIATASGIVANNGSDGANQFIGTTNQRFTQPDSTGFGLPYQGPYTMEAWFTPTADAAGAVMTRTPGTSIEQTSIGSGNVGMIHNYEDSASNQMQLATQNTPVGALTHLVATHDGSTVLLYINGVERARATGVNGNRFAPNTTPKVGGARAGAWLRGVLDEAAWYPTALTAARVLAHYNAGATSVGLATPTVTATGSGSESYVPAETIYTDSSSGTITATGSGSESYSGAVVYTDIGTGAVTASGTGVESAGADDSRTGASTASGTAVEAAAHTASGSGVAIASGSGVETYTVVYTDTSSGTVTATGSGVESYTVGGTVYPDTGTGTVTAGGTGVENTARTDTAAGTLTTAGTGTESATGTAAAAGTVTATGASTEGAVHITAGAGTGTTFGAGVDASSHDATATGTAGITGTGTDLVAHDDAGVGGATTAGAGTDTAQHTGAVTGTVTATGAGVETYYPPVIRTDAAAGTVDVAGAGVDASSHTATSFGTVTTTGAGSEDYAPPVIYVDTGTGTGTVTGDGVELYFVEGAPALVPVVRVRAARPVTVRLEPALALAVSMTGARVPVTVRVTPTSRAPAVVVGPGRPVRVTVGLVRSGALV